MAVAFAKEVRALVPPCPRTALHAIGATPGANSRDAHASARLTAESIGQRIATAAAEAVRAGDAPSGSA
eukprot:5369016-Heterocapsa_arctica.AAC.1